MRQILRLGWLVGLSAMLVSVALAGEIKWEKSLDAALAQAKQSNKLVMIDFYTDWCGWCKRLDKDTFPHERVVRTAEGLVSVKLNAEKEGADAAKRYNVQGFPTILFVNGQGEVFGRIGGYLPPQPFAVEMQKAIDAHRNYPKFQEALKKNPNDVDALFGMLTVDSGRGDKEAAVERLKRLEQAAETDAKAKPLMGQAYNMVGDMFQAADLYGDAIPYFQRGWNHATNDEDRAYAAVSIAACHMSMDDLKSAVPVLEKAKALKNVSEEMRKTIEMMLEAAKKGG